MKTKEKVEQGKGTADRLMPLGNWLSVCLLVYMSICLSVNLLSVYPSISEFVNRSICQSLSLTVYL